MLARASAAPAKAGATVRRIVLDANVFDQLRRGNIAAANKLLELVQKHEVYVSWEAFQEWVVRPPDRTQANTARQIIDKLKIKMAPPAPAAVVADLRARNSVRKGTATILSKESDLMIAAEAKALNAEVWSFDRAFKGNPGASVEKTLGVKVAAETTTVEKVFGDAAKVRQPKPKESRALRILGIKEDPVAGHLPEGKMAAPSTTPTGGGAAAKEAESAAAKEAESAAVKEAESAAVKEAESVAVKEAGEAVAGAAAKPKLYKRVAEKLGKLGVELIEGLVPDPLDALELMYDFAGSYKEAWNRIKQDNLQNGFAMGLAAYLVIPRWEWAMYWARTTVSRDVATQVIGAVGIAENAYNEGLVRGFLYGEKHSKAQADKLRQKAFNALVKVGNMPGHYEGDDVYTFGRNDVYSFAAVLHPTAAAVLKEAERRRAERLESEKLREDMKKWSRRQPGEV